MRRIIFICLALFLSGCESVALISTPPKCPSYKNTALSQTAEKQFLLSLHQGNYQQIPYTEKLLTAAYLKNPNDPRLAAHLGFLHIWKITERSRGNAKDPTIVNDIILARKYFGDAIELNPHDARLRGFLGDSLLIEGQIFNDQREQVRGYFMLQQAIHEWPEFNYFTAGYPMSTLSPTSKHYQEALAWQWKTLDLCAGEHVDRNNPDFSRYLFRQTQTGPQRACWNSWIAPHNFEGFFLNMGDMLVKEGDTQTAIKIYNNAKLSATFTTWPYRNLLITHREQAKTNEHHFNNPTSQQPQNNVLFSSGYGCSVCHQR